MNDPPNRWSSDAPPRLPTPGRPAAPSPVSEDPVSTVQLPQLPLPDLELSAIFGSGTAIHGTLSFSGKIRVEGEVEGHIKGGRLLIIGPGARVVGRIEADQVIVLGGVVEADIVATESIELYIPSQVSGELKSPQIYMDRGIRFQGTCDMTGSPPSVEPRPGHAF